MVVLLLAAVISLLTRWKGNPISKHQGCWWFRPLPAHHELPFNHANIVFLLGVLAAVGVAFALLFMYFDSQVYLLQQPLSGASRAFSALSLVFIGMWI